MGTDSERYDVWTRSARVHLSTPGERAVYLTLVGGTQESWSAPEIARDRSLDASEAHAVLTRFANDGIAERVSDGTEPPRYRWRADMDYIFEDAVEGRGPVDPVCGMLVVPESPLTTDWNGRSFRFCSSLCRAAFLAFPNSFASPLRSFEAASEGGSR